MKRLVASSIPLTLIAAFSALADQPELVCPAMTVGEPSVRIVGGETATVAEWPGFASLSIRPRIDQDDSVHYCGATAVSDRWLVTAAHCVVGAKKVELANGDAGASRIEYSLKVGLDKEITGHLFATLGTADLSEGEGAFVVAVDRLIIHPDYDPTAKAENDIALLHINRSWKGDLARIAFESPHSDLDGRAFVAGFGLTADPRDHTTRSALRRYQRISGERYMAGSDRLLAALVPPVEPVECDKANPGLIDHQTEFCAGFVSGSRDSCNADSGGPIVQIDRNGCSYQVGIVQSGQFCGADGENRATFGIYTRLSAYSAFIRSQIPEITPPTDLPETSHQAMLETARKISEWSNVVPKRANISMIRVAGPASPSMPDSPDSAQFFDGDGMYIEFSTEVPGQLILLNMSPSGELAQIYPSSQIAQPIFWASAVSRSEGRLPEEEDQVFPAGAPYGEGRVFALIAPFWAELDFRSEVLARQQDPTAYILDELVVALNDERNDGHYSGWGLALAPYVINALNSSASE